MLEQRLDVLDKGYVILQDVMGTDLTPVNAARVSFNKKATAMTPANEKLLNFLAEHEHTAPFRHAVMQFEVSAPLMVARQWWKHCIGSTYQDPMLAWNEVSHRYVQEAEEFHVPSEWRVAPANKKQGSGGAIDPEVSRRFTEILLKLHDVSMDGYKAACDAGIATEQARLFLPAYGLYIKFYWTCSLQGLFHFLDLRLDSHAQFEIREYAKAVEVFVREKFPIAYAAWNATGKSTTAVGNSQPS
jgi:thymidylate synthase (FAD)